MPDCKRCRQQFDKDDDEHNGMHWRCLSYDEKVQIERKNRCKHKKVFRVKICADCGLRLT